MQYRTMGRNGPRVSVLGFGCGAIGGLLGGYGRAAFGHLGGEIGVVDAGQQVAGAHLLVVGNQHLADVAGDPRADDGDVALDVGVVRRLEEAAGGPPVPAAACRRDEKDGEQGEKNDFSHGMSPLLGRTVCCIKLYRSV